jgi:hypothetical protein
MKKSILLAFAFVLIACGKTGEPPVTPTRGEISVASLMADEAPAAPVSNHWFMPQADASSALQEFSGILRIPEHEMHASITLIDAGDMWGMMLDEVYGPLGIHHMPMNMTKETDRVPVPLLGWGIYTTVDDIAKIAALMQNGGVLNGEQVLSERRLTEALYESNVRGLPTGAENEFGKKSYYLSFWHESFVSEYGKSYSAPKMVGWGGNIVQLMPNGIVGFRFGNGGGVEVEQMMLIANSIKPFDEFDRRGERRSE